jgi:hypothetical protein
VWVRCRVLYNGVLGRSAVDSVLVVWKEMRR